MLSLEAETALVSGVELHARLRCLHIERATRLRLDDSYASTQHEVVVVAPVAARADARRRAKIERRPRHRHEAAGGNQVFVYGSDGVGVDLQEVIEHITFTGQVEVAVLREID